MTDLSVAHRAVLMHLADSVSDRTLKMLAVSVASMPGEKARVLADILAGAEIDRARRTRGMAALAPLFGPAPEGMDAIRFPAAVLPRIWKIVAATESNVLAALDNSDTFDDDVQRIAAVCARLLTSAAAASRDQPDVIWPSDKADAGRPAALAALASAFDLGGLVQRALPSLKAWMGRPNGDQTAEFRLLVRDAAAVAPEGARLFLEILSAHLGDTPRTLRLIVNSSEPACRESFLAESELAGLVDRLIKAGEFRVTRIRSWKPSAGIEAFRTDLNWITDLLTEADVTMKPRMDGPWGKRLLRIRADIGGEIGGLLGRVTKTLDTAMPMVKAQTPGRMTREIPRLDTAVDPDVLAAAKGMLNVLRLLRTYAGPFGCEGQRQALVEALTLRLATYANQALEEINQGTINADTVAIARIEMVADFLEQIEAGVDARAVRRRVAVAATPQMNTGPSQNAA